VASGEHGRIVVQGTISSGLSTFNQFFDANVKFARLLPLRPFFAFLENTTSFFAQGVVEKAMHSP